MAAHSNAPNDNVRISAPVSSYAFAPFVSVSLTSDHPSRLSAVGYGAALLDLEFDHSDSDVLGRAGLRTRDTVVSAPPEHAARLHVLQEALGAPRTNVGGSMHNSLSAMQAFEVDVTLASVIGDDDAGRMIRADMTQRGLSVAGLDVQEGVTGTCHVLVNPQGERTMGSCFGIANRAGCAAGWATPPPHVSWVLMEGYQCATDGGHQMMRNIARSCADRRWSLSLSAAFIVEHHKDALVALWKQSPTLIIGNEDEAMGLTGASSPKQAAKDFAEHAVVGVVTHGKHGAWVAQNGQVAHVSAKRVNTVDETGAGDMFMGCLVAGIMRGEDAIAAAHIGAEAAGQLVTRHGTLLPQPVLRDILSSSSVRRG